MSWKKQPHDTSWIITYHCAPRYAKEKIPTFTRFLPVLGIFHFLPSCDISKEICILQSAVDGHRLYHQTKKWKEFNLKKKTLAPFYWRHHTRDDTHRCHVQLLSITEPQTFHVATAASDLKSAAYCFQSSFQHYLTLNIRFSNRQLLELLNTACVCLCHEYSHTMEIYSDERQD